MTEREVVIPGELLFEGNDYLPGEGTEKREKGIYSLRYGLAEETNKLVKVIPLSGPYQPRRGNVVLGKVEMITHNGWVIDIGVSDNAFLPVSEVPRYVNKNEMHEVMKIGDMAVVKVYGINGRGIDLTIQSRGLGKIDEGLIIKVNPNKVPRIIGKEGSMIKLIKDETECNITIGQNGYAWIKGDKVENELYAKKAILFVAAKSFLSGLTQEVEKWFVSEKSQDTSAKQSVERKEEKK